MTSVPLTVTAFFDAQVISVDDAPMMLDGPLSWAYAERVKSTGGELLPLGVVFAPDFDLPLARHDVDLDADVWVWCTSAARTVVLQRTVAEMRRKPDAMAMARYARENRHHVGSGPYKARNSVLPAVVAASMSWDVLCTDRADLEDLLGYVTHVGARRRNGYGRVREWKVEDSDEPGGWTDRPLPSAGGQVMGIRAPYWHHSRRHPCAWKPAA